MSLKIINFILIVLLILFNMWLLVHLKEALDG